MDDLEEGETEDFQKLGRYIYISSWTENPDDSLLLWSYSRGNDGIRIRMKTNIFKTQRINRQVMIHGLPASIDLDFNPGILELMMTKDVVFYPTKAELIEVTYTNLERLLKPTVFKESPGHFEIQTKDLGVFKRKEWEDQREWRYVLRSMPVNVREMDFQSQPNGKEILLEKIRTRKDFGFVDLPLKDDVFEDLEILCGPKMSDQKKEELNELLAKYAPAASVTNSRLRIRGEY